MLNIGTLYILFSYNVLVQNHVRIINTINIKITITIIDTITIKIYQFTN